VGRVGWAAAAPELILAFEREYQVNVVQAWGMTETSSTGAVAVAPAEAVGDQRLAYRSTQGRMSPLVQARLVDDSGRILAHDG
jgi:fatty-acyl-CoA synthase